MKPDCDCEGCRKTRELKSKLRAEFPGIEVEFASIDEAVLRNTRPRNNAARNEIRARFVMNLASILAMGFAGLGLGMGYREGVIALLAASALIAWNEEAGPSFKGMVSALGLVILCCYAPGSEVVFYLVTTLLPLAVMVFFDMMRMRAMGDE